ncbi:MAG: ADP-glyceromanno-heptose 6-epimerase [Elusimicrobia bacterium GWA2_69_24]|nr:MAG: ADP-glyceromanno-heptose 6-epimerase [Elusimicrobia bacterium GWA2_69_24]HBL18066.1 ADP-glyceromanno-heptose 6-epimerase [Elusimicrobiota bacterium]
MKRALVTGGAGFIGSNLALELERRGIEVVVLDDFSSGHFENLRGFTGDCVAGDVSRPEEWAGRVGAVDAVFHQAAITDTTVTDQKRMLEVNVEGFRNILSFALESGVRRVVYASSAGVYGAGRIPMREGDPREPMNVYGFSKKVMEAVGRAFLAEDPGLTLVGLRYFNVYGPREGHKGSARSMTLQLFEQMRAGQRPRIFKDGEQFRDFIYVKDVVAANLKAVEASRSGVYNVCTGRPATFNHLIAVLNKTLGSAYAPEYFENPYSFYQNQTQGDPALAERELGFKARFSVDDGIPDYVGKEAAFS